MIQIDHLRNGFEGSRWIFVNSQITPAFYESSVLLQSLAARAMQGSEEFTARPAMPLYLPAEPVEVEVHWTSAQKNNPTPLLENHHISCRSPHGTDLSDGCLPRFRSRSNCLRPDSKGLHVIEAELLDDGKPRAIYRSGYWIRDEAYLRSGPRITVNPDYLELDGNPLAVVGTTYMASEVQRLFFEYPNVYVWNRDLSQIHGAGLNMIRTGWWTGWDKFCDENGDPYERTLRDDRGVSHDRAQERASGSVQLLCISAGCFGRHESLSGS